MSYNLPHRINSEKDLKYLEDYLNREKNNAKEANTFSNFLNNLLGKLIKIDFTGGKYIGILSEAQADYLVLYLKQSCSSVIIPICAIKAISFNKN